MAQLRVEHVARVLELLQAARSGDDQIDAGLERVGLETLAPSADDAAHSQLGMLGDQLAHFLRTPARSTTLQLAGSRAGATNRDLERQLTTRHEDDCSRSIGSRYERRIARLVLLELLHQWQHIRYPWERRATSCGPASWQRRNELGWWSVPVGAPRWRRPAARERDPASSSSCRSACRPRRSRPRSLDAQTRSR